MNSFWTTLFPFIRWFPLTRASLRADLMAGITVALVLVPQSMAYASLAGLPVVYGLYASFVPVIVAAMWGVSSQLHTGPVAMLSLMSAAALLPFAAPGSPAFIELSLMLALMVGVLRLALGVFKLGAIVNLLSSPVIVGFTNAAALIIGLSQLNKVIGVPFPRSDSYLADLWRVIEQIAHLHWPTVAFAAGAWLVIAGLRRISQTLPGVLIAVAVSTVLSALIGYDDKTELAASQAREGRFQGEIEFYLQNQARSADLTNETARLNQKIGELEAAGGLENISTANRLKSQVAINEYQLQIIKRENNREQVALHSLAFRRVLPEDGSAVLYPRGQVPAGLQDDGKTWRFDRIANGRLVFTAGGAVVGSIPQGLPSFNVPTIHWGLMLSLLPSALVMALIGFMEATSISKAIATNTGQRVDTSKELIGQGLGNIAGSFFGSYTVSGSFSRSAVAARSGAQTGLYAIISALAVVLVLLFFTEYLYHLPQAVLAVIVMMAVFSLIRIDPLIHAWRIDRIGALTGVITFFATLLLAPAIANGILIGIFLTITHFLIKTMKPRAEVVSRKPDGTLGGVLANQLQPISEYFVPVRFDGSLTFVNVAYFEDMILEALADFPKCRTILVVGSGINDIDASGEEKVRDLADRLRAVNVSLVFSGLKNQVKTVFLRSGLLQELGETAFYSNKEQALGALIEQYRTG
ncbi:MAG: SulP family inorganic anion transporter [Pseudomonadota bacterium]